MEEKLFKTFFCVRIFFYGENRRSNSLVEEFAFMKYVLKVFPSIFVKYVYSKIREYNKH